MTYPVAVTRIVLLASSLGLMAVAGCAASSTPTISSTPTGGVSASASASASAPAGAQPSASDYRPVDVNAGAPFVGIDCLTGHVTPGKAAPPGPDLGGVWVQLQPDAAPGVTVREGAPRVTEVSTLDIVVGAGTAVVPTDTVTMDYCGVGLDTRTAFDSSWNHGGAFPVPLPKVISGWREGITGMKPGGTRLMLIPARLAFGTTPPKGSGITPDETIAFVVTIRSVGS